MSLTLWSAASSGRLVALKGTVCCWQRKALLPAAGWSTPGSGMACCRQRGGLLLAAGDSWPLTGWSAAGNGKDCGPERRTLLRAAEWSAASIAPGDLTRGAFGHCPRTKRGGLPRLPLWEERAGERRAMCAKSAPLPAPASQGEGESGRSVRMRPLTKSPCTSPLHRAWSCPGGL